MKKILYGNMLNSTKHPLSLLDKFKKYFSNLRPCVVKNLFITSSAIFSAQSPNLWKAKDKVGNLLGNHHSKPESDYQRLLRFFNEENGEVLICTILSVVFFSLGGNFRRHRYIVLDGTSWQYGNKKVHLRSTVHGFFLVFLLIVFIFKSLYTCM